MVGIFLCLSSAASARLDLRHKTHNVPFYVHEAIETGADATARIVARLGGNLSTLQLGALVVVDNVMTATADPASKALGKFQGLYILDGGQKYRAEVTVIIDQPGDLIECTYEILGQRPSFNSTSDRQLVRASSATKKIDRWNHNLWFLRALISQMRVQEQRKTCQGERLVKVNDLCMQSAGTPINS
jgi:hypothetical protein